MKRWMLLALAVVALFAPTAIGQEIENLPLADDWVSPGERVISQHLIVRDQLWQAMVDAAVVPDGTWTGEALAIGDSGTCANAGGDGNLLLLPDFAIDIPDNATILGIEVLVEGVADTAGDGVDVTLVSGTQPTPRTISVNLPAGVCGATAPVSAGGDDELWGRSWTRAQIEAGLDVRIVADIAVPTDDVFIDHVEVRVYYATESNLHSVTVRNTAILEDAVIGDDISKVEVIRVSDDRVIGTQSTGTNLDRFTTVDGIPVPISSTYRAFTGTVELEIRITLRDDVPLLKEFRLGDTDVEINTIHIPVTYTVPAPAALFTVGPAPTVEFDGLVQNAVVFPGQRFLAGRIDVDGSLVPFEMTIDEILLENVAGGTPLIGTYVDMIEVRRASDDALLGQATTTEIGKLTTDGTLVNATANNEIPAYSSTWLEIWVTLDPSAPTGQELMLHATVLLNGTDFLAGEGVPGEDVSPEFTVGEPGGFDEIENLELAGGRVFSTQRFLAQRLQVVDDDLDPYNVDVSSLAVQNVADPTTRLAETQVAKIEAIRGRDGALMGELTNLSGLNAGGVRLTTTANDLVADDTTEVIELWITLEASVPHNRIIRLETAIWHTEGNDEFRKLHDAGPDSAEFETGPTVGQGFETAVAGARTAGEVFQGVRFLAQRLELGDDDADPYTIAITSIMVRNIAPDSLLADTNVARVEVRRASDDALMGEITDPIGLSLAGVRVPTTGFNGVPDDGSTDLEIWVTLKQAIPLGRKLRLESIVWHTEGAATFETEPLAGPATFTTAEGDPPTNVDFTWAPEAPTFEDDVTFTPAANIGDPEGDIANATYAWDFGDGSDPVETDGSEPVEHNFPGGGTFDVTLTVTGEAGLSSEETHEVFVEGPPNAAPTIDAINIDPVNPSENESINFTAEITDPDQPEGTPFTYLWDFGDEATSTVASPNHTYTEKGAYTVTLTVTDSQGAEVERTRSISIGNEPPTLEAITANPAAPNTGDPVTFTATGVNDPDDPDDTPFTYSWLFGDVAGETPTETTVNSVAHPYSAPGTYTVTVTVTDARGGESDPVTTTVTVAGPTRVILYSYPNPASTAATVTYFLPEGARNPVLRIFDLAGRLVVEEDLVAVETSYIWDLTTSAGDELGSGLYFAMVTAEDADGGAIRSDVFRILVAR